MLALAVVLTILLLFETLPSAAAALAAGTAVGSLALTSFSPHWHSPCSWSTRFADQA